MGSGILKFPLDVEIDDRLPGQLSLLWFKKIILSFIGERKLKKFIRRRRLGSAEAQKSELSGWQLSTRKNFPDEVRKSFLRQKKHVNCFRDIKSMHKFFL